MDPVHTPGRLRPQLIKVHTPGCHDSRDDTTTLREADDYGKPGTASRKSIAAYWFARFASLGRRRAGEELIASGGEQRELLARLPAVAGSGTPKEPIHIHIPLPDYHRPAIRFAISAP
jgi:hypothetical protein